MPRATIAVCLALILMLSACLADDPPPLFYAVVADTQKGDDDPFADFAWAVEQINEIAPTCVLFPGDLTNTATENQYANFLKVADECEVPVHYAVGNHCAVPGEDAYRERFAEATGLATWYRQAVGGWHVVTLDSARFVDGELQHDGEVGEEQLAWLETELANVPVDEPIILMEHHPIAIEHDGLQNADEVLALFNEHYLPYTLTGHFHRNQVSADETGLLHIITGSLSFSLEKDVRDIGYRLVSTVGRDLWTCWVERSDPLPLEVVDMVDGPGEIAERWTGGLVFEEQLPADGRLALLVGYHGPGMTIKCGARILAKLPAQTGMAKTLVILSEKNSDYLAEQDDPRITVKPPAATYLSHIGICTTNANWEHHTLPAP